MRLDRDAGRIGAGQQLVGKDDGDDGCARPSARQGAVVAAAALAEAFAVRADRERGRDDEVGGRDATRAQVVARGGVTPGQVEIGERDRHEQAPARPDGGVDRFEVRLARQRLERGDACGACQQRFEVMQQRKSVGVTLLGARRITTLSTRGAKSCAQIALGEALALVGRRLDVARRCRAGRRIRGPVVGHEG